MGNLYKAIVVKNVEISRKHILYETNRQTMFWYNFKKLTPKLYNNKKLIKHNENLLIARIL